MKTAMQNHIADMKKIQEMVKSKNLDKDLEVTILESIEGCIENAESFLETEKEQIKNSYGAGAIDATSEEVLQVENNGWIKIESELELPNDDEPMWVIIEDCEFAELVQPDRKNDDFYGSDGIIYHSHHITHYQPIQKPEPPKF